MGFATYLLLMTAFAGTAVVDLNAAVPRPSPSYTLRILDGRSTSLDAYQGKVVLLAFIVTECPHCQRTSQMLNRLQSAYGQEALQVLAVAINDEAPKLVPRFVERFGISFPVGIDSQANARSYLGIPNTGLVLTPVLVVIDQSGNIQAEYGGDNPSVNDEQMLRDLLDKLIARDVTQTPAKRSPRRGPP